MGLGERQPPIKIAARPPAWLNCLRNRKFYYLGLRPNNEVEVEHCDHLCGPVSGHDGGTDAAKGIQRHSRALQSIRADRSPTRLSARI